MEQRMSTDSSKILEKSTKGVTFLMMAQVLTKLATFVLNNLLVRYLSPRIFGITAFLEFLSSTVLFFSRDAIRIATLRIKTGAETQEGENEDDLQAAVNLGYVPIGIGVPLSVLLMGWQYSNINEFFTGLPYFRWVMVLVYVSVMVELFSEPLYVVNHFMFNYKTRSEIESAAVVVSCVVNFCVVYWFERRSRGALAPDIHTQEGVAILAFALGKFARAVVVLGLYLWDYVSKYARSNKFSAYPTRIRASLSGKEYLFQPEILVHFRKVYFQLCFKHLLTEGDKLIINSLCTVEEQGIYSLLSNYGSLITRLLFAPIEESLLLFLTRLLSNMTTSKLYLSMEVLVKLTKFYLYLGIIIIIFGPINSSYLLKFLVGSKWSSTSVLETIRVYCYYLPFLSMNGILEAFFSSVASGDQILRHSYFMMLLSGLFLVNCWLLISYFKLSLDGLILSNIINMSVRIGYCAHFINQFYFKLYSGAKSPNSLLAHFSKLKSIGLISLLVGVFDWWQIGYVQTFNQLLINIALATLLVAVIIHKEKDMLLSFIFKGDGFFNKRL